jgi:aspartyl-tRNA(Asn)/glutamyl-tRNA(Gln) amidotransferase subunit A
LFHLKIEFFISIDSTPTQFDHVEVITMPTGNEICRMDAVTLASLIQAKELSPVEVIEAVLERMEKLEPILHAFCTPTPEAALADAKRIEAEIMAGNPVGPLAGVPIGIKDLVCTAGIKTVSGSVAYADFVPEEDDVVVERLKAAGAVILGKTNVPEFGYSGVAHNSVFETTRNPWNPELTSGGSSGGSGAAVATGMGPFAIGSDGGGSIRIPGSFCGLYGIKASMGRVPLYPGCRDERYPGVSSWESLEHIGPMSRTVADSALMLSVIAGPDERDRHSLPEPNFDWMEVIKGDIKGLKVAYSPDWGYAAVDPKVRQIVGEAVQVFERDLGCVVEEANPGWENPYEAFWAIVALESDLVGMRAMAEKLGDKMTPHLAEFLKREWTAEEFTNAILARKALNNKMWKFMRKYDLLLTPTLAVPPFETGIQGPTKIDGHTVEPFEWLAFTFPINFTGQPAATIPAGWTEDGLPVGLQIIGRHLDDPTVLRASAAFEGAAPWKNRWPSLLKDLGL